MTTLTIEIPDNAEKTLTALVEQWGGKVVTIKEGKKNSRAATKQHILDNLEESVKWVKLYQEGKVEAKPIQQLLNEL